MIHLGVINLKQDRIKHLLLYRYCKCWHGNQQKQYQDNISDAFTLRLIYLNCFINNLSQIFRLFNAMKSDS